MADNWLERERAQANLNHWQGEREQADKQIAHYRQVLAAALIAEGRENAHKWAGLAVRRKHEQWTTSGYGLRATSAKRQITQRGVVTLCDDESGGRYRNHWPKPGEWFVLSASGTTAYRLGDEWELDE